MNARDDYPRLFWASDPPRDQVDAEARAALGEIDRLRAENTRLRDPLFGRAVIYHDGHGWNIDGINFGSCLVELHDDQMVIRSKGAVMGHQDDTAPAEAGLAYWAWTILANVSEGDWTKQTPEWQEAVVRWRDAFHKALDEAPS
jgi:hypothetical protein